VGECTEGVFGKDERGTGGGGWKEESILEDTLPRELGRRYRGSASIRLLRGSVLGPTTLDHGSLDGSTEIERTIDAVIYLHDVASPSTITESQSGGWIWTEQCREVQDRIWGQNKERKEVSG